MEENLSPSSSDSDVLPECEHETGMISTALQRGE
jgi:hypothetical protein